MAVPTSQHSPVQERWHNSEESPQTQPLQTLPLNHSLRRLKTLLRFLGFIHDSPLSLSVSSLTFLFFGVAAPSLIIFFFYCDSYDASACRKYHVKTFELETLFFQATAAAISLLCFSLNIRKYGLRIFLFVDNIMKILLIFSSNISLKSMSFFAR